MLTRRPSPLALALVALLAALLGATAAAASASVDAYVGCSIEAGAKPAQECHEGARVGAFLTSSEKLEYDVCMTTPEGKSYCARNQRAAAQTTYVNPITTARLGAYEVVWTASADGSELARWSFTLTKGAGSLTPAGASAAFKALLAGEKPDAFFPAAEGKVCPRVYSSSAGRRSVCFAEFRTGKNWHLEGASATIEGGEIRFHYRTHASWKRKWKPCRLPRSVPGALLSNNGCGRGTINDDAYLVQVELLGNIRSGHPLRPLGWQFTFSEGFEPIGIFRGRRHGGSYAFTNAVGDSFRYTP